MGFWTTAPLCLPRLPVTVPSSSILSCDHSVTFTHGHSQSLTVSSSHSLNHLESLKCLSLTITCGHSWTVTVTQSLTVTVTCGHRWSLSYSSLLSYHHSATPVLTVTHNHSQLLIVTGTPITRSLGVTHSHFPSLTVAPHETLASLGCCGSAALSGELGPFGTFLVTLIVAGAVEGLHRPQVRQRMQMAYVWPRSSISPSPTSPWETESDHQ